MKVSQEEDLAKKLWSIYVRAQGPEYTEYAPWRELATRDPDTRKGFLAVAKYVLRTYGKKI